MVCLGGPLSPCPPRPLTASLTTTEKLLICTRSYCAGWGMFVVWRMWCVPVVPSSGAKRIVRALRITPTKNDVSHYSGFVFQSKTQRYSLLKGTTLPTYLSAKNIFPTQNGRRRETFNWTPQINVKNPQKKCCLEKCEEVCTGKRAFNKMLLHWSLMNFDINIFQKLCTFLETFWRRQPGRNESPKRGKTDHDGPKQINEKFAFYSIALVIFSQRRKG